MSRSNVSFTVTGSMKVFDQNLWWLLTNTNEPLALYDPELYARLTCEGALA